MSVVHFDHYELANLAACCVENRKDDRRLLSVCTALAELSIANTASYNLSYSADATPSSAPTLVKEAWGVLGDQCVARERGAALLRLLGYNCISNGGTDFIDIQESAEALDIVLDSFIGCYGQPPDSRAAC